MREILFRGKDTDTGKWRYSMTIARHAYNNDEIFSYYIGAGNSTIDGKTLGQYTGLTDKNGTKIFEGDIVLFPWGEKRELFSVEFVEGEFEAIPKRKSTDIWCIRIGSYVPEFEVIGNIHDNPELLAEAALKERERG